jgi:PAS domain S-box-containing protein
LLDAVTEILLEEAAAETAWPAVLQALCTTLHWDLALFWQLDEQSGALRRVVAWPPGMFPAFVADSHTFGMGSGLPGRVWSSNKIAFIPSLDQDDNFRRRSAAQSEGLRAGLAFPVKTRADFIGVIELFSTCMGGAERPNDALLYRIGERIGLLFERSRWQRELENRARIAALRAEVGAAVAEEGDLLSALKRCTDAVVKNLGVAFARIWTLDNAENVLLLRASSGIYTHLDGPHSTIPVGSFKIGWIAQKKRPHITNAVPDDPRITDRAWALREGMQAFAGYPLLSEDRVLGVLALFSRVSLAAVILDELAPVAGIIAQYLDRKRADNESRRNERLRASMLDAAFDAIIAITHTSVVLEFNSAAERLFGYSRAQALGAKITDLIMPPRFRDAHRSAMARYLASGEVTILGRRVHVTALRADGSEFPVELTVTRVPGEVPPIFTASIRDLTGVG